MMDKLEINDQFAVILFEDKTGGAWCKKITGAEARLILGMASALNDGEEYLIWVGNRWYAYGHIYSIGGKFIKRNQEFRPRFRTMRRLHDLHMKLFEDQEARELFKIYGDKSWS